MRLVPLSEIDFCVVDTETTGGRAEADRVIDVAVFQFKDGQIVDKFSSLVNPGRPIPGWITMLTGIDDDMVRRAPSFAEIADPLRRILSRGVFTAHNAGFDYGFIQQEFARLGQPLESAVCCTVKLSRLLFPELPSRSLGWLCEHLLIDIWDRHRAHGDAEATVYVLKDMLRKLNSHHDVRTWGELEMFLETGLLHLPKGLTYRDVARLPCCPGTFLLRDKDGNVVHKGKAKDIRKRVRTIFRASNVTEKSMRLRDVVAAIDAIDALEPLEESEEDVTTPASLEGPWPEPHA
jgi:DNA polymerase-3 subunit epsilon